jgi:hypothetical protein
VKQGVAEKSISAMCRTCAERGLTRPCKHNEKQKAFISVYTFDEIAYAVNTLNYKLLNIYEAYVYTKHEPIFKEFLHMLAKYKVIKKIISLPPNYRRFIV